MTNTRVFGIHDQASPTTAAEPPHRREAKGSLGALAPALAARSAVAGEPATLESWLAAARPRLVAVALRIVRDPDDAEDVVQEAMIKVWRHAGAFEARAAFSTWLHRIAVNAALDHLRTARRHIGSVAIASFDGDHDTRPDRAARAAELAGAATPEDLLGRAEVGAAVRTAMGTLSPLHREVLTLRELDGESYRDIAARVRCPVGTVMSRLHNARHRLERLLLDRAA